MIIIFLNIALYWSYDDVLRGMKFLHELINWKKKIEKQVHPINPSSVCVSILKMFSFSSVPFYRYKTNIKSKVRRQEPATHISAATQNFKQFHQNQRWIKKKKQERKYNFYKKKFPYWVIELKYILPTVIQLSFSEKLLRSNEFYTFFDFLRNRMKCMRFRQNIPNSTFEKK